MRFSVSHGQAITNLGLLFFLLQSQLTYAVDTDGDGLDDSVETNTGTYVSTSDTGTDPNDADTDNDAIPDGLDLPPDRSPLVANWMVSAGDEHACALDGTDVGDSEPAGEECGCDGA